MAFIFIIVSNIIYDFGDAKLYHFDNDSGCFDSNISSSTNWERVLDEQHPPNYFETASMFEGRSYVSTWVDGDGVSTLDFDWKKIGDHAKFIFYFDDNKTDENDIRTCEYSNSLDHEAPRIPAGHHKATWDFRVIPGSSGGSQAWLDNINIPEISVDKPDCTITAPYEICANSTYESSVPIQPGCTYTWELIGCTPKSSLNVPRITWISERSGSINLKVTVTKNNSPNYSTKNLIINSACEVLDPPGGSIQSIINNSSNKILYLKSGIYGGFGGPKYPVEINENVKNLTIRPAETNEKPVELDSGSAHYALGINNTSSITINNLNISMGSLGIIMKLAKECKIFNNNISFSNSFSNGSGIYLDNCSWNYIQNNYIKYDGPGYHNVTGFALYYSNYNNIFNNHVLLPKEKFVFFMEKSCNNSVSYYISEGHIHENCVDCNETWNKCHDNTCRSCTDPMFASCNKWWYL